MAWKDRITGRSGQQVLSGANFALYTLIVIALIVLVNWFVSNHDKRWDMTPNKKYSLSDQTRKILKGSEQGCHHLRLRPGAQLRRAPRRAGDVFIRLQPREGEIRRS